MRLSKIEVEAIADAFIRPIKNAAEALNEKHEKDHWTRWLKTADGKAYSKLPEWLKNEIDDYRIKRSAAFKALAASVPKKEIPSVYAVREMVIMSSIDAKDVGAIRKALEKAFK